MDWVLGWCDSGRDWRWARWLRVLTVVFVGVFELVAGECAAESSQEAVVYLVACVCASHTTTDRAHDAFVLAVWTLLGVLWLRRGERAGRRGVVFLLHRAGVEFRSDWW